MKTLDNPSFPYIKWLFDRAITGLDLKTLVERPEHRHLKTTMGQYLEKCMSVLDGRKSVLYVFVLSNYQEGPL